MSTPNTLLKSAGIVGIATLCSRFLGFLRDVVIARFFGLSLYAQAFVVAFRIPNLFRDLVGEGATNAAVVPVLSEYRVKHPQKEYWQLVSVLFTILMMSVAAITLMGVLFSPVIVRIVAPGFLADPEKLSTTVWLTRVLFPYIFLVSLAAYCMAVLHSLRHFTVPAFAPCLLNVAIITCAFIWRKGVTGLAAGVLIGGVLQLAIHIPILWKKGFRFDLFRSLTHPALRSIRRLMAPRMLSSGVYQLNNFVDSVFGSFALIVGDGGVAVLYFAYRLVLFPIGIFSTSLSNVLLPYLSTQALDSDKQRVIRTLSFGLRMSFLVLLPASAGLLSLSYPILSTLFQGGNFDADSALITSRALMCYSVGLCFFGSIKILHSSYFSLKDTATPAKISIIALLSNIILNAVLMFPLKIAGIALATSLSGINTFIILFYFLKKKLGHIDTREIAVSFLRIFAASCCMALVSFFIARNDVFVSGTRLERIAVLSTAIILGIASFFLFSFIFKVREIREFLAWYAQKKQTK